MIQLLLLLLSRFSRLRLCATPETAAHQAPLSLGFSRQEHWSGLPFPSSVRVTFHPHAFQRPSPAYCVPLSWPRKLMLSWQHQFIIIHRPYFNFLHLFKNVFYSCCAFCFSIQNLLSGHIQKWFHLFYLGMLLFKRWLWELIRNADSRAPPQTQ